MTRLAAAVGAAKTGLIEIDHVTKRFGAVTALDDLDFAVHPGLVTGLLGPNGAGKTTTMSILLGLQAPTSGRALVAGRLYRDLERPLRQVGALLDADAVHPARSARGHLAWVAQTNRIGSGRVEEVLRTVGLEAVADKPTRGYSLGMKQRLGIAQALLGDAPVLILDEPVNGLDTEGIRWVRRLLKELAAEGRTILVSSHLMGEMSQVADRLIVLGRGRLLADDSLEGFIASHTHSEVVVRTPEAARLARILRERGVELTEEGNDLTIIGLAAEEVGELAASHGCVLHQLRTDLATLEEAYLALTGESVEFGSPE